MESVEHTKRANLKCKYVENLRADYSGLWSCYIIMTTRDEAHITYSNHVVHTGIKKCANEWSSISTHAGVSWWP